MILNETKCTCETFLNAFLMAMCWCKNLPPFSDYVVTLLLAKWMTFL